MSNQKWLRTLLCCALVACTVFTLCACPSAETGGHTAHTGGKATCTEQAVCEECGEKYGELGAHAYVNGTCTVCGAKDGQTPGDGKPVPDTYADGAAVKGGGATIEEGSFALSATTYDESTAEEIKAIAFFRGAQRGEGKVFRISDGNALTISNSAGQSYDGKGSILIAPQGVVFENCHDLSLSNLTIIGSVTVTNVENLTMERVEIVSADTALTVDAATTMLKLNDCRLTGKTAISLGASDSVVLNSYLAFTEKGVVDTAAEGTTIRNCILEGAGVGITTKASDAAIRGNTITLGKADTGIILESGMLNTLVALNDITGAQKTIVADGVRNTAIILNRAVSIEASNSKNLYVCDNSLGGRLTVNNNNFFLCDGNTFPEDEW
ncbi:MAG: hypothetical protein IJY20_02765, partial [Clostridia bacterium]|nr:hypothetical protein [Clostridia bacterium]